LRLLIRAPDADRIEAIIFTNREPRANREWGKAAFCTAPGYGNIGPRQIEWNMNAFDFEYGPCNAVSAAGIKAKTPLVVTADMEAFVLYEVTDRAVAMEHNPVRVPKSGPYPGGKSDPGAMNSGTISTRCHQFHPKTHRVCCLSLCEAR